MPTLTGDANGEINADLKSSAVGGGIGTWFKGSSAPVSLGVAVPDLTDMASAPPPPQAATLRKPSPASVSRFSLFGSKPAQEQLSSPRDGSTDECLTLDISTALMPTGLRDPKSSQAFHELQAKADALLHKMQNAYKSRTLQLQEASNEREALQEEKEEAETRSRHLKMQLEQMAIRLADQETTTQEIARELALERQRRHEEALARKRSVALVTQPRSRRPRANGVVESSPTTSVSDSGFDSDDADESSADSIFSRAQGTTSPTGTLLSSTTRTTSPEPDQQWSAMSDLARPPPPHRASTFDKVLKVISKKRENEVEAVPCPRCQGSHGSGSSWDLRQENMELKERVAALEGAVEGCLGTLGGSSAF
ncbi:MAG: hypothetical protein M1832_001588 [Thelocarpon impressellum]|nr:MAG: hypothetical protein M1832_001588 [Thelocarpon impressellum]